MKNKSQDYSGNVSNLKFDNRYLVRPVKCLASDRSATEPEFENLGSFNVYKYVFSTEKKFLRDQRKLSKSQGKPPAASSPPSKGGGAGVAIDPFP
jgi:hypothetical protein